MAEDSPAALLLVQTAAQEARSAVQRIQARHPQLVLTQPAVEAAAADAGDAAAAAAAASSVAQPGTIEGVVAGCISLLVTVHKLTDPSDAAASAGGMMGTVAQQLGAGGVEAALDSVLQQLKPQSAANMQAYSDIVATVGQLKVQLARAC
jgi:hypothetical protein